MNFTIPHNFNDLFTDYRKNFNKIEFKKQKLVTKKLTDFFFGWPLILITIFRSQLNEGQRYLPFPTKYSHFYKENSLNSLVI